MAHLTSTGDSDIEAVTVTATGTVQQGRTRLKTLALKSAGSGSPQIVLKDSSTGATLLDMSFNQSDDFYMNLPGAGILFKNECHVTLTAVDSFTGFFA